MPNEDLKNFIRTQLIKGSNKQIIRDALLQAGYLHEEIEEALAQVYSEKNLYISEGPFARNVPEFGQEVHPLGPEPFLREKPSSRKFIFIFLALILLFSIVGASFYYYRTSIKADVLALIPQDTPFYLRINIDSESEQVKNFKGILEKFPFSEEIKKSLNDIFEELKKESPFLEDFDFSVSKELIITSFAPFAEQMEKGNESLVLIFVNPDLKKLEKLAKDIEDEIQWLSDWKTEKEDYKGRIIVSFSRTPDSEFPEDIYSIPGIPRIPEPEPFEVFMAFTNGHLAVCSEKEDIKKIIDTAKDQEISSLFKKEKIKNIGSGQAFQKIKRYLPEDYLVLFYGEALWSDIFNIGQTGSLIKKENISPFLASFLGAFDLPFFKPKEAPEKLAAAFALIADKNEFETQSYILNQKKEVYSPEPFSFENSLSQFIPESINEKQIISYTEANNLKKNYQDWKKESSDLSETEKEFYQEFIKDIEQTFEIDLEKDVLEHLQGNYAYFAAAEPSGKTPPELFFISEVNNEEKVKQGLLKMKVPDIEQSLEISVSKENDRWALRQMDGLAMEAAMFYSENRGSYLGLSCNNFYTRYYCENIEMQVGASPIIRASTREYCAFVKLNEPDAYYCVDSNFTSQKTYINPDSAGFCSGRTFVCPKEQGTPSVSFEPEKHGFSREEIQGFEIYSLLIHRDFYLSFSVKDEKLILGITKQGLVGLLQEWGNSKQKRLKDSKLFKEQFRWVPKEITSISYGYPFGAVGPLKYAISFLLSFSIQYSSPIFSSEIMAFIDILLEPIFEFVDRGIAPFLKVLESSGSYSCLQENNFVIQKGKITLYDLSAVEKREAEEFWENIDKWLEEKFAPIVMLMMGGMESTVYPEYPNTLPGY